MRQVLHRTVWQQWAIWVLLALAVAAAGWWWLRVIVAVNVFGVAALTFAAGYLQGRADEVVARSKREVITHARRAVSPALRTARPRHSDRGVIGYLEGGRGGRGRPGDER